MPKMKLTQLAVKRLKPPAAGRVEYWDTQCPGFGLRVSAPAKGREGRKTWQVLYRVNGKSVRETIGTTATIPKIEEARERARESLTKASAGINPIEQRQRDMAEQELQRQAVEAQARDTLAAAIDRYLEQYARQRMRPDYFKETNRALEVDVAKVLGARPIRDLTRREIRDLLGAIVARGRAPHASHVLAYLRAMLNWAVREELVETSPAEGISDPDPRKREDRERDRWLDDAEVRLFWLACNRIGRPFGPLFQLLLLTAARRDEMAAARWGEFDLDRRLWVLPRHRSKNGKAHLTHLSDPAMAILESLPRICELLFSTTGRTPVSGFGRGRDRLVATMAELGGAEIEPFTLHDLRRTAASHMAELGVGEHIVDRVLNHSGRKVSGTARIYNRHEYLPERQAALDLWAKHVVQLVQPAQDARGKVIELALAR